jgi:MinD-like ATPase involved in chromosome partitioning or flagellar assembly
MLSDLSLAALDEASMVLWVTSTDFSSINNSLAGLEALEQMSFPEDHIKLILNITSSDDGVRPAKIQEVLRREFFWSVPYDKQVRLGSQVGTPAALASPASPGSRALTQLAEAVTGATPAPVEPKKASGLWPFRRRTAPLPTQTAEGG